MKIDFSALKIFEWLALTEIGITLTEFGCRYLILNNYFTFNTKCDRFIKKKCSFVLFIGICIWLIQFLSIFYADFLLCKHVETNRYTVDTLKSTDETVPNVSWQIHTMSRPFRYCLNSSYSVWKSFGIVETAQTNPNIVKTVQTVSGQAQILSGLFRLCRNKLSLCQYSFRLYRDKLRHCQASSDCVETISAILKAV